MGKTLGRFIMYTVMLKNNLAYSDVTIKVNRVAVDLEVQLLSC